MAATKIIVNHNGSIRVEGDFEIVDPEGRIAAVFEKVNPLGHAKAVAEALAELE